MIINSIRVQRFRSIKDQTLECDNLTALVGPNGSGKSSFLRALELFYAGSVNLDQDDFYNRDIEREMIITIVYSKLTADALGKFSRYVQDGILSIERVITFSNGKFTATYHGSRLQCSEFVLIRSVVSAKEKKEKYNKIRSQAQFEALPDWKNTDQAQKELENWEKKNPANLERIRDDGQFFGFTEVAQGYLGKYTRLLFISAVRDVSVDAEDKRGSVLTDLMDLVVRNVLANKDEVNKLNKDTQTRYEEILDPSKLSELKSLSTSLNKTLKTFVPDASVNLLWQPLEQISIPMPKADAKLVEDEFESSIERTGHGLQRAFIFTLLQHLELAQYKVSSENTYEEGTARHGSVVEMPNLILAIEEPELYQHPNRQRHLSKILLQFTTGPTPGVAEKTQILYATHSPFFVGIDRINNIRLIRKVSAGRNMPKMSRVVRTSLDTIAELLWKADGERGEKYNESTLIPRLQSIMSPWMSEGFFANVVVLVEGEDDRAAILAMAQHKGSDLESMGISVIPCNGKTNIDRPALIFRELGIDTYLIWDSDKNGNNAKPEDNHRLLRILGEKTSDWPSGVFDSYSCFEKDLDDTLTSEFGEGHFKKYLKGCQDELRIPKEKHAKKNPVVIEKILKKAEESGLCCKTLEAIIDKILSKKST